MHLYIYKYIDEYPDKQMMMRKKSKKELLKIIGGNTEVEKLKSMGQLLIYEYYKPNQCHLVLR